MMESFEKGRYGSGEHDRRRKAREAQPMRLSSRSFWWALSRASVWSSLIVAAFLYLENAPGSVVLLVGGFGVMRLVSLLSTDEVEERVRLRDEKARLGLQNTPLDEAERELLRRVDDYRQRLLQIGGDPSLADAVMRKAWSTVESRRGGAGSSRAALEEYIARLPRIESELDVDPAYPEPDLDERLEQELRILRATHRELNT